MNKTNKGQELLNNYKIKKIKQDQFIEELNKLSAKDQIFVLDQYHTTKIIKYIKNPLDSVINHVAIEYPSCYHYLQRFNLKSFINILNHILWQNHSELGQLKKLLKIYLSKHTLSEEDNFKIIKSNSKLLKLFPDLQDDTLIKLMKEQLIHFAHIPNPSEKVMIFELSNDSSMLRYIENPTEEMYHIAFKTNFDLQSNFPSTRTSQRKIPINIVKKYFKQLDKYHQNSYISSILYKCHTYDCPSINLSILYDLTSDTKLKQKIANHKNYKSSASLIQDELENYTKIPKIEKLNKIQNKELKLSETQIVNAFEEIMNNCSSEGMISSAKILDIISKI